MPTSPPLLITPGSPVRRQAMYIGGADTPLFAVLHTDPAAMPRNCIAVICPPLGYEYVHSHRSLRHLADALARSGMPALRFDYHGTGDSPGTDLDPDRLAHWLQDIRDAIAEARILGNGAPVCLLGVRMGAALAALIAAEIPIDWLVMWFPVLSGRRYVREMKAVGGSTEVVGQNSDAPLESAGFLLTQQTQAALGTIDMLKVPSKAKGGALLIQRDDLSEDNSLFDHLAAQHINVESTTCPGYAEMMAQPVDTQVPQAAIDATVNWLAQHTATRTQLSIPVARPVDMHFDYAVIGGQPASLVDQACRFGADDCLFGIYTEPAARPAELPTVVLFNSGVVHRVGTTRLYTLLSREMAALGFPVFRFDLEGIGDSVLRATGHENVPYPDTAMRDVEAALDFLKERFGAQQFIPMGLCSGAYYAFLTGISPNSYDIPELVMINPPHLNWKEDGFLASQGFGEAAYYRDSMRSGSSWKKLLRGQVNVLKVAKVALSYLDKQALSQARSFIERIYPKSGSVVANQLRSLYARKRHVTLFTSSSDPCWDILMSCARQAVATGMKRGGLTRNAIANADHTFSSRDSLLRMVSRMRAHLMQRYGAKSLKDAP